MIPLFLASVGIVTISWLVQNIRLHWQIAPVLKREEKLGVGDQMDCYEDVLVKGCQLSMF